MIFELQKLNSLGNLESDICVHFRKSRNVVEVCVGDSHIAHAYDLNSEDVDQLINTLEKLRGKFN